MCSVRDYLACKYYKCLRIKCCVQKHRMPPWGPAGKSRNKNRNSWIIANSDSHSQSSTFNTMGGKWLLLKQQVEAACFQKWRYLLKLLKWLNQYKCTHAVSSSNITCRQTTSLELYNLHVTLQPHSYLSLLFYSSFYKYWHFQGTTKLSIKSCL